MRSDRIVAASRKLNVILVWTRKDAVRIAIMQERPQFSDPNFLVSPTTRWSGVPDAVWQRPMGIDPFNSRFQPTQIDRHWLCPRRRSRGD